MDAFEPQAPAPDVALKPSPFGIASLVLGGLVVLIVLIAAVLALAAGTRREAALMLWTAIPLAMLGMALAVVALIQPGRSRSAAAIGIWLNGVANVLIVPLAMALSVLR